MVIMFNGNREFDFDIVGESRRQRELEHLAGPKTQYGCEHKCFAALVLENDNPHDQNAVAVSIIEEVASRTLSVGYLKRSDAIIFREGVAALNIDTNEIMLCAARIIGGWDNGRGNAGLFGVKLDLEFPIEVNPAFASIKMEKVKPKQSS